MKQMHLLLHLYVLHHIKAKSYMMMRLIAFSQRTRPVLIVHSILFRIRNGIVNRIHLYGVRAQKVRDALLA